ncbi:pyridoxamine 5'-phosphate oxidase family protein [Kitasatospora sp. NPDC006697]|uniref:pyridoxamine 5'-phosphate oxidase family protein n=1 Tax=Kitasatospora sp. NPDC006697 TaxID=3364020 RepID=UPI0036A563AC
MTAPMTAPHAPLTGEQLVRRRAGFDRPGFSGPTRQRRVPPVAAEFLSRQPMVVLGAADPAGRLWAGLLTGRPGFLQAESDPAGEVDAIAIAARPADGDPLAAVLAAPARVGGIALEPATRRRARLNGPCTPVGSGGLRIELEQFFGNCPKYIQSRELLPAPDRPSLRPASTSSHLTDHHQELISTADTFFLTTADGSGSPDTSHRGGNPGFVEVLGPNRLRWPDYSGNAMFATLGNLAENPAAGLLFLDWRDGSVLQLTGTARTDWDPEHAARVPGAQRLVEFELTEAVGRSAAVPLRWGEPAYSPFNP